MVFSKSICMENNKIEAIKQWLKPQSVWDIQVFLGFANIYRQFIQGFSQIAALLISMLKTSSTKSAKPRKDSVRVDNGSRDRHHGKIDNGKVDGNEIRDNEIRNKIQNLSMSKNLSKSKKMVGSSESLTPEAKLAFTKLKQVFFKTLILHHFNPECYIQIETDISGYAISRIPS